eukprot:NODE_849_length_1284_cov_366.484211_g646_i0.p2 GENE.NODE_849_length_1284_cov_366.484211_g646_i0~~NODE_849_length_1284_cov_366.484211_g646_i0.p2  ORF type:complete len:140 (+),score=42.57 NODE_849_length_1284_cov_366.484211_g646_i0:486-905(+)
MKPAWDQLGSEYAESKSVVIADVDCTVEKELCEKQGVSGYPTIKYWVDGAVNDYSGGRDLSALQTFVGETLEKESCDIDTPAECEKKEQKYIKKMRAKTPDELEAALEKAQKLRGNKYVKDPKFLRQKLNILKQLQEEA